MSTRTKAAETELTPYESEQIQQIAVWKSSPPNPFAELFNKLTLPVADLVEKVIPDNLVITVIEKAYKASELIAGQEDIKRRLACRNLVN